MTKFSQEFRLKLVMEAEAGLPLDNLINIGWTG